MTKLISIGIPVKNEVANISDLMIQVTKLINQPKYGSHSFELLVNDNLSDDGSVELLSEWARTDNRVKVFSLMKPLDFQATIQDLMKKAEGELFALLQSDLQDPVLVLEEMLDISLKNLESIVVARAIKRKDVWYLRWFRQLFYGTLNLLADKNYYQGFQDFYVLPKYVYKDIAKLPSQSLFIRGYLNFSYSRFIFIEYIRSARVSGKSNFRFNSLYDLALDGLLLYGRKFIRVLSIFSFLLFFFSFSASVLLAISASLGYYKDTRGWASIAVALMISLSFLGMLAGLVLEYLIRIHRQLSFRKLGD